MNVFEVKLTRQAEEQIREVAWHIAVELHNPDAAEKLMDSLGKEIGKLGRNPEKNFLVDEEPWRSEEIRWKKVRQYLVYFWVDVENAAVQVIGICYGKRDQKRFLNTVDFSG